MSIATHPPASGPVGIVQSVQIGTPQTHGTAGAADALNRPRTTSFFRAPVVGPRWLFTTHLDGNAQADTKNHGRPSQAILMYAAAHYPRWQEELGIAEIGPGGFAENVTVDGLTEENVAVGDVFALGEGGAAVRVSGPRFPCSKIEYRWQTPGLTARVGATGRTGWYCYTDHEGMVEVGMSLTRLASPYPDCTIARLNAVAHGKTFDRDTAIALLDCPILEPFWREQITRRLGAKA